MNSKTKIKVDRLLLIEKIKEKQAERKAEYEAAMEQYMQDHEVFRHEVVEYLRSRANKVRQGTMDPHSAVERWKVERDAPDAPTKPREPRSMDMAIAQLEIAAEGTVQISGEDFAAYMK